jgi:hypothetical protein
LRVHVDSEKHEDGMDEKVTPSDIRFGGASVIAKPCESVRFGHVK